jgi:hypothetical protein
MLPLAILLTRLDEKQGLKKDMFFDPFGNV